MSEKSEMKTVPGIDLNALIPTRVVVVPAGMTVDYNGDDETQVQRALEAIAELRRRDYGTYLVLWQLFLRIRTSSNWDETYHLAGKYFVKYRFVRNTDGNIMRSIRNRVLPHVAVAMHRLATTQGVPEQVLLWENLPWLYRVKVRIRQFGRLLWRIAEIANAKDPAGKK
ncbi:MAG: hypothetical protein GC134_02485 [Proteobacteria bacterium]|nr:hypothetical protein [Pseudomonadota bacterium]